MGESLRRSEVVRYFYLDQVGSRRLVKDAAGNVTDKFSYSAWGEVTQTQGSNLPLANYTGKGYDGTGFVYFNARYYDPTLGRFLSEDPSQKGTSWYTYCGDNPLARTDPTGMREEAGRGPRSNTVSVPSVAPTVIVTYSGKTNSAGARTGTATAYPASAVKSDVGVKYITKNDPAGVTVPIVSGAKEAAPTPAGTYPKVKQSLVSETVKTPEAREILTNQWHGGAESTWIPLPGTAGRGIHQANSTADQSNAETAGCIGVTTIAGSGVSAPANFRALSEVVGHEELTVIVTDAE